MASPRNLSPVALSNLFTKAAALPHSPNQKVEKSYKVPKAEIRMLLAKLVFEEALETIRALGIAIEFSDGEYTHDVTGIEIDRFDIVDAHDPVLPLDIDTIIDGACDTIYVATGVLVAMGVPDLPHLAEVCRANDRKFPKGVATIGAHGKYLKPAGWKGPDHAARRKVLKSRTNLPAVAARLKKKGRS